MDKEHLLLRRLLRRAIHMCAPIGLVYYLIPDRLWLLNVPTEYFLYAILILVIVIEIVRLTFNISIFGLRKYEDKRLAAYAWAGFAMIPALLYFPKEFVIPIFFGMGWVDPLIGEIRKHKPEFYPYVPILVYALIMIICLRKFSSFKMILYTIIGTATAISVEYPKLKYIDDDFLMIMVPLVVLTGVQYFLF